MGVPNGNGNAPIDVWLSRWAETTGGLAAAGWGAVLGAWRCEAQGEEEDARRCRERAIEFWAKAGEEEDPITTAGFPADQLLLADTLRRLGRFEEARGCCHRGLSGRPGEPIRSLLEFEGELITSGDTEPHPVSEVLSRRM
jgi:hypothetical protein